MSGDDLSRRLGIEPDAVWSQVGALQKQGYEIVLRPDLGYRLVGVPDRLLPAEIRYRLETSLVGCRVVVYEETSSTMDVAHRLARAGEPAGTCVLAESQRAGRGRIGRQWHSPKGEGICLSVILRPALPPHAAPQLTLLSAVATAAAIRTETGVPAQVKWPNDIVVHRKKVCGILTEMQADAGTLRYLIVGIGINVNTPSDRLPSGATSLLVERGEAISRIDLCRRLLLSLDERYATFSAHGFQTIAQEWEMFSSTLGGHVRVEVPGRLLEGQAVAIDGDGALLVRKDQGIVERVVAGDVIRVR